MGTPKEHIMKRRSIVILLVLVFLLVGVGLFARGGYRFDSADRTFQGQRGFQTEAVQEGTFERGQQAVRQQLHTPGEDCPLGEDCLYLETGEVQYQYQDENQAAAGTRGGRGAGMR